MPSEIFRSAFFVLQKTKSFPFSVLTLLRRLFLLAARQSVQAPSALAPQRRFRFPLQAKTEKLKFSVFRFPFSVYFTIFVRLLANSKQITKTYTI